MPGKLSSFPSGIQSHEGQRATSIISTNSRARTTRGFVGLVTDTVIFPTSTGVWFMGNQRVRVNNMPTVAVNSFGISTNPGANTAGTMIAVQGDDRVDGT